MADTTTPVLGLIKPEVGASTDNWGPKLHSNYDAIDALFTDAVKKMLALAHGGTGADTAAGARTNLGLGDLATMNGVGSGQIANGAITSAKIADNNVTSAKIADSNVTSAKIADSNVTSAKIADANVTTGKIADNAVATAKIPDSAITTAKVADEAITIAKLAAAVVALLTPVGTVSAYVGITAPSGWLLLTGGTIGSASSGATLRANADTATLYGLLWDAMSNTELAIQTSAGAPATRGANAAADFAANKRLPVPDLRGRVIAGQDDMGGTSADRLTNQTGGLNGDIMGTTGGAETHTLLVTQIPAHAHTINYDTNGVNGGGGTSPSYVNQTGKTVDTANAGGGLAHNNVQPTIILNYIVKY